MVDFLSLVLFATRIYGFRAEKSPLEKAFLRQKDQVGNRSSRKRLVAATVSNSLIVRGGSSKDADRLSAFKIV